MTCGSTSSRGLHQRLAYGEKAAANQWKGNARQFLGYGRVKHLRDARADRREIVGVPRPAGRAGQIVGIPRRDRRGEPIVRVMKAGVKYSDEILAPGRVEDGPGTKHLAVRGHVELVLYPGTVSTPDLASQGLGVSR